MWAAVRRIFRSAPVTASCIFVCSFLLAWVYCISISEDINFNLAQAKLGALLEYAYDGVHFGPMNLWEGQWWRVFISGFHHGSGSIGMGLFHLVTNCLALWVLGGLLEYRIGSLKMVLLMAFSIPVSMLPQIFAGDSAVGISGAICAVFGYLIVLRTHDEFVRDVISETGIKLALLGLVVCIPLTHFGIFPVANVAHFSGLFYGMLAGWVFRNPFPYDRLARGGFLAGHLLIPVAFYLAMNPVWDGLYHWHYSTRNGIDASEKRSHLREAVALNPHLEGAWIELSDDSWRRGDRLGAWKIVLLGVRSNPSGKKVISRAKQLGRDFHIKLRRNKALSILREVFDEKSKVWEKQMLAEAPLQFPFSPSVLKQTLQQKNSTEPQLKSQKGIDGELPLPGRPQPLPAPDPNAPDSAAEGTTT